MSVLTRTGQIAASLPAAMTRHSTRRSRGVANTLVALTALVGLVSLCHGQTWETPWTVLQALVGEGDAVVIVRDWRAPRVVAAIVFGAGLGVAGAVFQNLTRNPLGSPDIIGLDAGAHSGALFAYVFLGGGAATVAFSSTVGGLLAAAIVFALARGAGNAGMRLIVFGIAVHATLTAVNAWSVLRIDLDVAMAAQSWSVGTLNGLDWDELTVPVLTVIGCALVAGLSAPAMHQSVLGDDLAVTTGVNVPVARGVQVAAGVGCVAGVISAAGPVVFVALAAPQIGRRLMASPGTTLTAGALTGALLLTVADLLAQLLLSPASLPVGVVTTAIGGAYLIWLLLVERRRP